MSLKYLAKNKCSTCNLIFYEIRICLCVRMYVGIWMICSGFHIPIAFMKYKEGYYSPSSVNQISLVHNHDKAGNKCYTQDNTDIPETQVCKQVPGKSKPHLLWPPTRRGIKSI